MSFGGPLALAALYAPTFVADASASAGLAMVAAAVVFAFPLVLWLRYSRQVSGSGGLHDFVEAAAGRRVTLLVAGLIAGGQLAIAAALGGLTVTNLDTPISTFGASAPAGPLATATGQTALLYICGSLPLFLGGELTRPARTIRRGLTAASLATAVVIVAAVAPLAAEPAFTRVPIPGMTVAEGFAGHGFAVAVGVGVAVS